MSKLTLAAIAGGYGSTDTLNANKTAIEAALENTLSRDGTSPNAMGAPLDMNSNRVLNLPAPTSAAEPVRLIDVQDGSIDADTFVVPSQSGHDGHVLASDGAVATWQDPNDLIDPPAAPTAESISAFYPVVHPSSGNIQGSGFAVAHQLVYTDANVNFTADAINLQSSDPSALVSVELGGSTWAGDVVTLHFIFAAQNIAVSYTVQSGNQLSDVATALAAAIMANASLFVPVSPTNTLGGGLPGQILYVVAVGNFIHFDYNVAVPMTMTASVTGPGLTETVTLPNGGSPLPTALDANPVFALCRNAGVAPAASSNIGQYGFFSTSSAAPSTISVQYGSVTCDILNSTSGSLAARVGILTCNPVTGGLDRGIFVGSGLYSPSATSGDKGVDTANFKGYYIDGVNLAGNLPATATNDNALAGRVGEYVSSDVAAPGAAMTTLVSQDITAISLTQGDWDVWAEAAFTPNGATTVNFMAVSLSLVSATLNNVNGGIVFQPFYGSTPGAYTGKVSVNCGPMRVSVNTTTIVYMVGQAAFGVNTLNAAGLLRARRVR